MQFLIFFAYISLGLAFVVDFDTGVLIRDKKWSTETGINFFVGILSTYNYETGESARDYIKSYEQMFPHRGENLYLDPNTFPTVSMENKMVYGPGRYSHRSSVSGPQYLSMMLRECDNSTSLSACIDQIAGRVVSEWEIHYTFKSDLFLLPLLPFVVFSKWLQSCLKILDSELCYLEIDKVREDDQGDERRWTYTGKDITIQDLLEANESDPIFSGRDPDIANNMLTFYDFLWFLTDFYWTNDFLRVPHRVAPFTQDYGFNLYSVRTQADTGFSSGYDYRQIVDDITVESKWISDILGWCDTCLLDVTEDEKNALLSYENPKLPPDELVSTAEKSNCACDSFDDDAGCGSQISNEGKYPEGKSRNVIAGSSLMPDPGAIPVCSSAYGGSEAGRYAVKGKFPGARYNSFIFPIKQESYPNIENLDTSTLRMDCDLMCNYLLDERISPGKSGHCFMDVSDPCISMGTLNDSCSVSDSKTFTTCNMAMETASFIGHSNADACRNNFLDDEKHFHYNPECLYGGEVYPYNGIFDCVNTWTDHACNFKCVDSDGMPLESCFLDRELDYDPFMSRQVNQEDLYMTSPKKNEVDERNQRDGNEEGDDGGSRGIAFGVSEFIIQKEGLSLKNGIILFGMLLIKLFDMMDAVEIANIGRLRDDESDDDFINVKEFDDDDEADKTPTVYEYINEDLIMTLIDSMISWAALFRHGGYTHCIIEATIRRRAFLEMLDEEYQDVVVRSEEQDSTLDELRKNG